MSRTLTLLFRRDPLRDRQTGNIHLEGYETLWPDGRPVAVGVDALCKHGQRSAGTWQATAGLPGKTGQNGVVSLAGREDDMNRIPGYRVRRFYLRTQRAIGRLHFMDGTPTIATFDVHQR